MDTTDGPIIRVTYMELCEPPRAPRSPQPEGGRVLREQLPRPDYLALYGRVGQPLQWDQRLKMPQPQLEALLDSGMLQMYVLRNPSGEALGLCEFDCSLFPQIELKNFGLVPEAQGRGHGSWLLHVALEGVWKRCPTRIWLHTDEWDHPAAVAVYEKAGFRTYAIREESANPL